MMDIPAEKKKTTSPETIAPTESRWHADYAAKLIPNDYGLLVPYVGQRVDFLNYFYGLMTYDGEMVTEPIYNEVISPTCYALYGNGVLLLKVLRPSGNTEYQYKSLYAVAAQDGSWVTDFIYTGVVAYPQKLLLINGKGITIINLQGRVLASQPAPCGLSDQTYQNIWNKLSAWGYDDGTKAEDKRFYYLDDDYDNRANVCVFDSEKNKVVIMTKREYENSYEMHYQSYWYAEKGENETILYRDEETLVIPYSDGLRDDSGMYNEEVVHDLILFRTSGAVYTLSGKQVLPPGDGLSVRYLGDAYDEDAPGLIAQYEEDGRKNWRYYREDGTPIPELNSFTSEQYNGYVIVRGGIIEVEQDDYVAYYDMDTLECIHRMVFRDTIE